MQSNAKTKSRRLAMILALAVLALVACSNLDHFAPTTPEQSQPVMLEKKGKGKGGDSTSCASNSSLLLWAKWDDDEESVDTAIIGPAGGVLLHAKHRLEIPAGALSAPITVSFSTVFSDTMQFEFEPDGTQFTQPVRLVFNYNHACTNGVDVSKLGVVVWDPAAQLWGTVPSQVDTVLEEVSGDVTGFTPHFSRYAIIRK